MTHDKLYEYFIATMAVIGCMLVQLWLLIWGDSTLSTFILGEIMLLGCLGHLRMCYKKDLKESRSDSNKV